MSKEILEGVRLVEKEKGIEPGTLLAAIEDALLAAYRKMPDARHPVRVDLDRETLDFTAWSVTPQAWDAYLEAHPHHQILAEAPPDETEIVSAADEPATDEEPEPEPEIEWDWFGDEVLVDVTPENFSRIAGQTAKQVLRQRINEAERSMMYDEYADRVGEIVTGIVQQDDHRYAFVDLGRMEAILPGSEKVPGERYEQGSRIKAVIIEVRSEGKGPQVVLSRRSDELIRQLFELEVPEIADGLVEIRAVAREPGYRAKIAVESKTQGVDPVGACVGPRGSRVRMVVSELRGEKIDIIPWNDEPARFVAKALAPAKVREVYVDDEHRQATVVVPDGELSLAIGKEGLNARLAHRLTGWRIDIVSETEYYAEEAEHTYTGVATEDGGRVPRPLRRRHIVRQALSEPGPRRKPLLRCPGPPGAGGQAEEPAGNRPRPRPPVRRLRPARRPGPASFGCARCVGRLSSIGQRRLGAGACTSDPSAACAGHARRREALATAAKNARLHAAPPTWRSRCGMERPEAAWKDLTIVAKKTAEQEKPQEPASRARRTAAEPVEAAEAAAPTRCPPNVVDDEEEPGASTARRPPRPPSGPGQPGRHARPQRGVAEAAAES